MTLPCGWVSGKRPVDGRVISKPRGIGSPVEAAVSVGDGLLQTPVDASVYTLPC